MAEALLARFPRAPELDARPAAAGAAAGPACAPRPDDSIEGDPSVLLLVLVLDVALVLAGMAAVIAAAHLLFPEARGAAAAEGAVTGRRRAPVDPNEAARAAGSRG
ncbi:hypothetical protein DQ238_11300 [Geodermatophilus sp. TF02-6]|uniref:hypothetical protein n=1 Tax=Geodermatophilus sp. TF02-6 TaxID=2250575 RepID=UPI000DE80D59|nr:hypothetical protein [Geodermatophilus sp. TF02-6]RBY78956.1 hypothetical protein DQ238_11300 [Geodermatophilus sp. TF02-6]